MEDDLLKYAERAGDILADFSKQQKANLKPPEEAAKELLESEKNLKTIESKFLANSIDILYDYIKFKYPKESVSENAEKLMTILKALSGKEDDESIVQSKSIYQQLVNEMQIIEDRIQKKNPDYKKKFI